MRPAAAAADRVPGSGLVLPRDPVDTSRAVARAYQQYLVDCCRRFLAAEPLFPPAWRAAHRRIAGLIAEVLSRNQRALLSCFASPAIATSLHCLDLREQLPDFRARIDGAGTAMPPHLLLEMALRQLIPERQSVLWEHGAPPLASIALGGQLSPPDGATGWRFSSSHVAALRGGEELGRLPATREVMHRALAEGSGGFRFERRFRRVGRITCLATIDHNPIAQLEAHPEKAGNTVDLGGRSEDEWIASLDDCFALIEHYLPGEFAEMETLLQAIVPIGYDDHQHLSASYREAVGIVYLSLHPNPMTMTEAVIHEFQHNKFNVASHGIEYLTNAFSPLYKSPIRPDPRPLWGIALAVHAFLPVAELYRRMRDAGHPYAATPEFERRMSEIDLKNHEGMDMLRRHAQFTPAGRVLFDELEGLERRHLADRAARGLDNTPTEIHVA